MSQQSKVHVITVDLGGEVLRFLALDFCEVETKEPGKASQPIEVGAAVEKIAQLLGVTITCDTTTMPEWAA